jgi:trigger factor
MASHDHSHDHEPSPTKLERKSDVMVTVTIDVPWDRVRQQMDKALGALQRTARVRGFRPGKVPRHVLQQLMGPKVRQEVVSELLQHETGHAIDEHKLEPLAVTPTNISEVTQGQPLSFTVDIEVRPKIESVDTSTLQVEHAKVAVAEEAVDKALEELRTMHANLVAPEPARAAQAGDVVEFDMTVAVDGQARDDLAIANRRVELGQGGLIEEIEQGLEGLEVGATRDIAFQFPEHHEGQGEHDHDHDLHGKQAECTLTLKTLLEKRLPDLDDEFAKDLEQDSLDALRKQTRTSLEEKANQQSKNDLRERLLDALIEHNPVEPPPSLVQRQQQARAQELIQLQRMMGQAVDLPEDFQAEFRRAAERNVKAGLLLGALATQEKLEVDDAAIDAKIEAIASDSGKHPAKVKAEYAGERRESLRSQILQDKLLELLEERATIREPGSSKAKASKKTAEKKDTPKKAAAEKKTETTSKTTATEKTATQKKVAKKVTKKKVTKKKVAKNKAAK